MSCTLSIICQNTSNLLIAQYQVDCEWSGWGNATTCSKSCGGGKHFQTRTIVTHEENGGAVCNGENMQEINCNVEQCPTGIDLRMRLAFNKKKD